VDRVLQEVHENPQTSVQQISQRTGPPHSTVHSVVRDQDLLLSHYIRVQRLTPEDHRYRVRFCDWILERYEEQNFATFVL
jgi:DNA-binding IclR family transcriptional regulator